MPQAFIEHVNLTVSDPERSARLFGDLFGWKVRWAGEGRDGGRVLHVGDERHYLAVWGEPAEPKDGPRFAKGVPLNHVGIVVEDLDEIERRVISAGLVPFSHGDYEPGRRFYFFDWDGIEYEMVSYG